MILNIMLVNGCNLTCKICGHYKGTTREHMEYNRYLQVLNQCKEAVVPENKP